MTKDEFSELLDTTEPVFLFRGQEYQICAINGRYLAGFADTEEFDQWFDDKESLLFDWILQGVALFEAISEITFIG